MSGEHEQLCLKDCSIAQWDMNSHLVTVEVCIEASTYERVQTDGLTFHQFWLESLDTETVQGRSTVEQDGMAFKYVFENFPYDRVFTVNHSFSRLHCFDEAAFQEFSNNERFEQLAGHIFGETALVHLEFGPNHDNGTTRVVDTFTEQVLTETTLFALE